MKIEEILNAISRLDSNTTEILTELGVDNSTNAVRKIRAMKKDLEKKTEIIEEINLLLSVDNWANGLRRLKSLIQKG